MEWLREIFNDGVPGDAARVLELCGIARAAIAAGDPDLALNLLLGAALRCWWADTGPAARARVVDGGRAAPEGQRRPPVRRRPRGRRTGAAGRPGRRRCCTASCWRPSPTRTRCGCTAWPPTRSAIRCERWTSSAGPRPSCASRAGSACCPRCSHAGAGPPGTRRLGPGRGLREEGRRLAHDTGQPIWDTGTSPCRPSSWRCAATARTPRDRGPGRARRHGRRLTDLLACVQLARGFALISAGRYAEAYEALRRLFDPGDPSFHLTERFHGVDVPGRGSRPRRPARTTPGGHRRAGSRGRGHAIRHARLHLAYARAVLADDDEAEELLPRGARTPTWSAGPGYGPGSSWPTAAGCAGSGGSPNPGRRCASPRPPSS